MDSRDYVEKWINGTLTEEERILFEQTSEYRVLKRLSDATRSFRAPDYDIQGEFARLQARMTTESKARLVVMPWLKPLIRVAAVLVVAAATYFVFLASPATTVKTLPAEKATVYLPDSSVVELNAISQIAYHAKRWTRERRVSLEGEAFFRVAKGSRFDVETASGIVTVLGTEFSVKIRNDFFEVVCYEGLVEVSSTGRVAKLTPTRVFRVSKGVPTEASTYEIRPSWLNDESSFESVPFAEVLEEFERQYRVTVTTQNVDLGKLFTGRFGHSDLNKALQSISIPLNLTIELSADHKTVLLSGEAN